MGRVRGTLVGLALPNLTPPHPSVASLLPPSPTGGEGFPHRAMCESGRPSPGSTCVKRLSKRDARRSPDSRGRPVVRSRPRQPPASSISASAPSTARTRRRSSKQHSRQAISAGASPAHRYARQRTRRDDPQDGLYTLVTRDGSGDSLKVMGVVREVLVAPENPRSPGRAAGGPGRPYRHPDRHRKRL